MTRRSMFCCAVMLAFGSATWAADKTTSPKAAKAAATKPAKTKAAAKPVAKKALLKPAPKKPAKTLVKSRGPSPAHARIVKTSLRHTPAPSHPQPHALRGKTEVLTCRDGTEDRHARIALVLVGGRTDGFAYYSKWKPRTCSIYLQRNRDPYSKWSDSGSVTNVNLERGQFLVEHRKNEYRLVFRDVDRERYCGMDGTINGTLTVRKGSQHCEISGIMEEGVPLGQAYAQLGESAPSPVQTAPAAAPATSPAPAASASETKSLGFFARHFKRQPQSTFPSAAVGLSD